MSTPMFSINFADVPDNNTLPEGYYPVVLDSLTVAENSAQDGYNLIWQMKVSAGPHKGNGLRIYSSLKQNALWRVKQVSKAFGFQDDQFNLVVDDDGTVLEPDLVGETAVVKCLINERDQNNVTDVYPISRWEEFEGKPVSAKPQLKAGLGVGLSSAKRPAAAGVNGAPAKKTLR